MTYEKLCACFEGKSRFLTVEVAPYNDSAVKIRFNKVRGEIYASYGNTTMMPHLVKVAFEVKEKPLDYIIKMLLIENGEAT